MHLPQLISLPHQRKLFKTARKSFGKQKNPKDYVSETSLISRLLLPNLCFFLSFGVTGLILINVPTSPSPTPTSMPQHPTLTHLRDLRLKGHPLAFLCVCAPSPYRLLSNRLASQQVVFNAFLWTNPWTKVIESNLDFLAKDVMKLRHPLLLFPPASAVMEVAFDGHCGVHRALHSSQPPRSVAKKGRPMKLVQEYEALVIARRRMLSGRFCLIAPRGGSLLWTPRLEKFLALLSIL